MPKDLRLIKGDTAGDIIIPLRYNGAAKSLAGATVRAFLADARSTIVLEIAGTTFQDINVGSVRLPAASRATWPSGTHRVWIRVQYADGSHDWFPSVGENAITIVDPPVIP